MFYWTRWGEGRCTWNQSGDRNPGFLPISRKYAGYVVISPSLIFSTPSLLWETGIQPSKCQGFKEYGFLGPYFFRDSGKWKKQLLRWAELKTNSTKPEMMVKQKPVYLFTRHFWHQMCSKGLDPMRLPYFRSYLQVPGCHVYLTDQLWIRGPWDPLLTFSNLIEWLGKLRKATCFCLVYHKGYDSRPVEASIHDVSLDATMSSRVPITLRLSGPAEEHVGMQPH